MRAARERRPPRIRGPARPRPAGRRGAGRSPREAGGTHHQPHRPHDRRTSGGGGPHRGRGGGGATLRSGARRLGVGRRRPGGRVGPRPGNRPAGGQPLRGAAQPGRNRARRPGRARLRHPGHRGPLLHLHLHAAERARRREPGGNRVLGARPPQPERRRPGGGPDARSRIPLLRGHGPAPPPPRDDGRRTGAALRGARGGGGPGGAREGSHPQHPLGGDGAAVAPAVAQHTDARERPGVPGFSACSRA